MDVNELINEGCRFHFYTTDFDEKINDSVGYAKWKQKCKRYLSLNFKNDKYIQSFEEKCDEYHNSYTHNDLIGMLVAFRDMPTVIQKPNDKKKQSGTIVNVHQTQQQEQTQSQEIAINIFLEAIKDELTGKQVKELKAIVANEPELEKARSKIMEKLKSFGENVLTNIVANVITNPSIWGGLM